MSNDSDNHLAQDAHVPFVRIVQVGNPPVGSHMLQAEFLSHRTGRNMLQSEPCRECNVYATHYIHASEVIHTHGLSTFCQTGLTTMPGD